MFVEQLFIAIGQSIDAVLVEVAQLLLVVVASYCLIKVYEGFIEHRKGKVEVLRVSLDRLDHVRGVRIEVQV